MHLCAAFTCMFGVVIECTDILCIISFIIVCHVNGYLSIRRHRRIVYVLWIHPLDICWCSRNSLIVYDYSAHYTHTYMHMYNKMLINEYMDRETEKR